MTTFATIKKDGQNIELAKANAAAIKKALTKGYVLDVPVCKTYIPNFVTIVVKTEHVERAIEAFQSLSLCDHHGNTPRNHSACGRKGYRQFFGIAVNKTALLDF